MKKVDVKVEKEGTTMNITFATFAISKGYNL